MKKVLFILLLLAFSFSFAAEKAKTTFVLENTGGIEAYTWTGTNTAATDHFIVAPSAGYYTSDDMSSVITCRFDTDEATADSVRWTTTFEAKVRATDSWIVIVTFADTNSTSAFSHTINPLTYGVWPITRWKILGADGSKTALQTITGQVTFKKDPNTSLF